MSIDTGVILIKQPRVPVVIINSTGDVIEKKTNETKIMELGGRGPKGQMGDQGGTGPQGDPGLGALTWNYIATTATDLVPDNGYHVDNPSLCVLTLPLVFPYGKAIAVMDLQGGMFRITQRAGQSIQLGKQKTTTGTSGYLVSSNIGDTITIQCIEENNKFVVWNAVGIFNYF